MSRRYRKVRTRNTFTYKTKGERDILIRRTLYTHDEVAFHHKGDGSGRWIEFSPSTTVMLEEYWQEERHNEATKR